MARMNTPMSSSSPSTTITTTSSNSRQSLSADSFATTITSVATDQFVPGQVQQQQQQQPNHHHHQQQQQSGNLNKTSSSNPSMSILAAKFVPERLLQINKRPVSRIIDVDHYNVGSKIQDHSTSDNNNNNNSHNNNSHNSKIQNETRRVFFGLISNDLPGVDVRSSPSDIPTTVLTTDEPDHVEKLRAQRGSYRIPIETMSTKRDNYVNVFRECLQVEYEETRRLYERYNQYEIKITPLPDTSGSGSGAQAAAKFFIPGIADARPPLMPGDMVIIRPHDPVVVNSGGYQAPANTPAAVPSVHSPSHIPHHHHYNYNNNHIPVVPTYVAESSVTTENLSKKQRKKLNKANKLERKEARAQVKTHRNYMEKMSIPYFYNDTLFVPPTSVPPPPPAAAAQRQPQVSQQYPNNGMPELVEVHCRILNVSRGNSYHPDSVFVSFVGDQIDGDGRNSQLGLATKLTQSLCTVRFVPSTTTHERSLTALCWLQNSMARNSPTAARDLLFPTKIPDLPPTGPIIETDNDNDVEETEFEQLNRNQARFVQMVSSRTDNPETESVRPPLILTGPAGTGKSKTLLVAVLQTLNRNKKQSSICSMANCRTRILLCTPSHTACDVLTRRLAKLLSRQGMSNKELKSTIFRLIDMGRPVEMTPVDILPYTRQTDRGDFCLPSTHELLDFSVVICTCEDAHLLYLSGITNSSLRQRRLLFQEKVEKSLAAAGLHIQKDAISGANVPHFTHLFIDEAAQATEPESLIPISVVTDFEPNVEKAEISLAGDPRQLSPSIFSLTAQECLQRSLLERLLRLPGSTYGHGRESLLGPPSMESWVGLEELIEYSFQKKDCQEHLSVFLNLSYRGHPSFLYMPSKLFYFDKLRSALRHDESIVAGSDVTPMGNDQWIKAVTALESASQTAYPHTSSSRQHQWPIHFRGVLGQDRSAVVEAHYGSNSWCNEGEAKEVLSIVDTIIKSGVGTNSLGVMALFRAQVILIRKLLRDNGYGAVNVGTVENYQAVESDVVILSLTRSNEKLMQEDRSRQAGIFFQPKRMNVALTRAENLLVVVGNPNIMQKDPAWKEWLGFVRDSGLWYGEKLDTDES